jgi:hypothetical protein
MKTDSRIQELIAECRTLAGNVALISEDERKVLGAAPLLAEAAEQLFGQRQEARAFTDKMYAENLKLHMILGQIRDAIGATPTWNSSEWETLPGLVKKEIERIKSERDLFGDQLTQRAAGIQQLNREIAELKAQLSVAERMSTERNDARVAGLREIEGLKSDLAVSRRTADERLDRIRSALDELNKERADNQHVRNRLASVHQECTGHVNTVQLVRNALGLANGQNVITEAKAIREERDSLRLATAAQRESELDWSDRMTKIREALGLKTGDGAISLAREIREERDLLRLKLETQTKMATEFGAAVDRLTREQVERMKAIREGKLVERLRNVFVKAYYEQPEQQPGEFSAASVERSNDAGIAAILSDLAQMPVNLPSAADVWTAWQSARNESHTGAVVRMLQTRLGPVLAAREVTKIELPTEEELRHAFIDAHPTMDHINIHVGIHGVLDMLRARLGLTEQKPTTKTESVATREDTKPVPNLMSRFNEESGRAYNTDDRQASLGDIRALIRVLDS